MHQMEILRGIHKKDVLLLALVVLILLAIDLSPFGGNLKFYAKWIECGQKPVRISGAPGAGMSWYEVPPTVEPIRWLKTQVYYCTPLDAEKAGYSATEGTYTFPHLEQAVRN